MANNERARAPSGYAGTSLPRKLGIKPSHRVALLRAPAGFAPRLVELPDDVRVCNGLRGRLVFNVVLLFCRKRADLAAGFAKARDRLATDGGLWIAWPKKASGLQTDLGESVVRDFGLAAGLVDNKICAIDEIWSGLRFVIRLKDRK